MIDKKAYRGASIQRWIVIILERQQRFSQSACDNMIQGLRQAADAMGMPSYILSFIVWFANHTVCRCSRLPEPASGLLGERAS